jgi:hypothetical protein
MNHLQVLALILVAVVCMASADGVAEDQNRDRTGSPDGSNTCDQCHTGGGFSPTISISLENELSEPVTSVAPGETYELTVSVENFFPFPDVYGFQATALMEDLSNAGSFSNPASNVQIENVDNDFVMNRHVVEHNSPSFVGNFSVDWTAPLAGDSVYFYAAGVTGNGNNEPEGDNGGSTAIVLPIMTPDGILENSLGSFEIIQSSSEIWIDHPAIKRIDELIIYSIDGSELFRSRNLGLPFALTTHEYNQRLLLISIRENGNVQTLKVLAP